MKILVYEPGTRFHEEEVDENYRKNFGISLAKNIVVKAGSDVLLSENGRMDKETIHQLFEQMVSLLRQGKRVTYITSGAKVCGKDYVSGKIPDMSSRSFCIAGQPKLMDIYHEIAGIWPDLIIGQALLEDIHFQDKRRQETKKGFDDFFYETKGRGIIIVNANDAMWTGETKYDNDALAANIYKLLGCDLGIFLTNVDGLYKDFGTENRRLVNLVRGINTGIYCLVSGKSESGTGGLETKLKKGIKKISDNMGKSVIANGKTRRVILDILDEKNTGTLFL